jgi:endothelin-converting enzyme
VNAYYDPSFNQFVFLEGILHPPLFHPEWPDYFLYGSMGIVIGHELTHGFDNNGQKYDLHGNYRQWWTKSSQKNFNDRTKCYVDQYGNYTFMGFKV